MKVYLCDRCEKIIKPTDTWYSILIEKHTNSCVSLNYHKEQVCPACYSKLFTQEVKL